MWQVRAARPELLGIAKRVFLPVMNAISFGWIPGELRRLLMPWGFSLLLPMPILLMGGETGEVDVPLLYLGLGSAWLGAESVGKGIRPQTPTGWRIRMAALAICLLINAAVFTAGGGAIGVRSNIPLALLAVLSVTPALGLVPWLVLRLEQPYTAVILGGLIVALTKIAACVVARIVYGPDYIAEGYVSADWQTAKLMISLMWTGIVGISLTALVAIFRRNAR